ncbi:hypothetical protein PP836_002670 [Salmonella enterica]|nr:hypothetical protein [Salmonella enterica subsp. diarizonae]EKL0442668.1 hypothetical protein [Salmonella enterica]HCM1889064.1 hypothetical protein [Salmonella enterica subsp. diarizonae serovar 57:c:z]
MGFLGAGSAAKAAAKVGKQVAGDWKKLGNTEYSWFSPYMDAGKQTLSGQMSLLANPVNSQEELATYYASPEYDMMEQQEQYAAQTSAADPYSGMGGSATSNYLGNQAVSLGQNYLKSQNQARQQQFNNLGSISKLGLSASGTMGNLATKDMRGVAEAAHMASEAQMQASAANKGAIGGLVSTGLSALIKGFGSGSGAKAAGGTGLMDSIESGGAAAWKGIEDAAEAAIAFL